MSSVRAEAYSPFSPFGPGSPLVGQPRYGRANLFLPGGRMPGLRDSYLSRLGLTGERVDKDTVEFGLGDHIAVPLTRIESQLTSSLVSTAGGLFSRARALRDAAGTLVSGTPAGVFDRRTASASDSAVSAAARDGAAAGRYSVDVRRLAVAQQNAGTQFLTASSPSDVTAGTHTFQIAAAGVATVIGVTIGAGATNMTALASVRDAIAGSGAAVEASILTKDDVAQLVLTARKTGAAGAFTATDLTGSVLAQTGTGAATRTAQDADVSVNGVDYAPSENALRLDVPAGTATPRLALYFHAVTAQTVHVDVDVAFDAGAIVSATGRLVDAVNQMREFVEDKPRILSRGLLARLGIGDDALRDALAAVGVYSDATARLSLDQSALLAALESRPSEVERAIGSIQGLAARERSVAQAILDDTSIAFSTRPGALGATYGRTMANTARMHAYVLAGLFVNVLA